ncbi:hypothetical protein IID22_02295, partial [Patescibacteria group bacterium]|nr:hypothetical protein [Patescibacteria group bacterium]
MEYKYHILERVVPADPDGSILKSLMLSKGYPENPNVSEHDSRFIAFDGCKKTDIEPDFTDWYVVNAPPFM